MAKLTITEFSLLTETSLGRTQIVRTPPVVEQQLLISGVSNPSAAFNPATVIVRLKTDTACSIAWGASPVATSGMCPLEVGQTEYFGVVPGRKLAVIAT